MESSVSVLSNSYSNFIQHNADIQCINGHLSNQLGLYTDSRLSWFDRKKKKNSCASSWTTQDPLILTFHLALDRWNELLPCSKTLLCTRRDLAAVLERHCYVLLLNTCVLNNFPNFKSNLNLNIITKCLSQLIFDKLFDVVWVLDTKKWSETIYLSCLWKL